jgi:Adenine specific DNA methylase Mod
MPTLNWIGKKKIVNHHRDVPYCILNRKYSYDTSGQHDEDNGSKNVIIHGDNLYVLKSLLPKYEGKIKSIYIDPPYNTGNSKDGTAWKYTDRVDDPIIEKWLNVTVGAEGEDMTRHDKWLCMMYPRLKLLHRLLSENGIIFISIDDNELLNLKHICDDIFGKKNHYAQFTWISDGNFDNQAKIKICHEYVLAYAKNIDSLPLPRGIDVTVDSNSKIFKEEIRNTVVKNGHKNPPSKILLKKGFPCEIKDMIIKERYDSYPFYHSDGIIKDHLLQNDVIVESGWSSNSILKKYMDNNFEAVPDSKYQDTTFVITESGNIDMIKKRVDPSHVKSILMGLGSTQNMSNELKKMDIDFKYSKPVKLIEYLLGFYSEDGDIILDSFAGSNATSHAVLELNKKMGYDCKFIAIELNDYADAITAGRIKKIIDGYENVPGIDSSFSYYELGVPLLTEEGLINEQVENERIHEYIFFTETGQPYAKKESDNEYYLGSQYDTDYYFYYKKDSKTILNDMFLHHLNLDSRRYVIYADLCTLSKSILDKYNITFKKIPRDISRL